MYRRKPNAMLIELVIVILFFSISAGIILQLFVAANDRSVQSATDTAALLEAENMAELLVASRLPLEDFLADTGWDMETHGIYTRPFDVGSRSLLMVATCETSETDAGTLDSLQLTVMDKERKAVVLPVGRYLPSKEVTP